MHGCNNKNSDMLQLECMKYTTILTVIALDYLYMNTRKLAAA
jgi:hypothetical protein